MSSDSGLLGRLLGARLDVLAAVAGLLVALALFPLRFLSSQIYIQTLPIVLGVACVLYLVAVRGEGERDGYPSLDAWFARLAPALVLFGLAAAVLLATVAGERSRAFYDVAGVVGTILLAQILLLDDRDFSPGLVLGQVVLLALVVRFAALYTAPGFIGVDVWSHTTYIEAIAREGALSAIADSKYYAAPLYHYLAIAAAGLLDLSFRNGLYLSLGLVLALSVLLVYGAARPLVSPRWAAFAAGGYAVADHVVRWGIHIIPTGMGLVFFLGVLLLLVRYLQHDRRPRDLALLLVFSSAVILTHQISSFIMLVLVGAGLLGQVLLRFDLFRDPNPGGPFHRELPGPANLAGLLVFDVGLITFLWSLTPYQGDTFLETVLSYLYVTLVDSAGFLNGVSSDGSSAASGGASAGVGSPLIAEVATYVDTLGFLLLLFTTVVGCLVVLRRHRATHATFTLLVSVVVMLVFVLGLPLFNVTNFVPGRWFAFLYAPMALLTAVALRYLAGALDRRVLVAVVVLFALVFPSVMLMSSDGTPDSPVFPSQNERLSYTETELTAVETLGEVRPAERPLYTDHPYATVFVRTDTNEAEVIRLRNGSAAAQGPTVYRDYQSDGGSFFRIGEGAAIRNPSRAAVCPPTAEHVYANGDVRLCLPSAPPPASA